MSEALGQPDWTLAWGEVQALVGSDLSDGTTTWGADVVESGAVRRFVEPLELSSPIHHDEEVARGLGYDGLVAPAASLLAFMLPPMWRPGEPTLYTSPERDAQPARSAINNAAGPGPRTRGFFVTDVELDFLRPVVLGERIGMRGRRLLACRPKETRVGRGAFCTHESDIVSDRGDVVARLRTTSFAYDPHEDGAEA